VSNIINKSGNNKNNTKKDHLFRVTETARYVINCIKETNLDISEIENILLKRSALMRTTKTENNKLLRFYYEIGFKCIAM